MASLFRCYCNEQAAFKKHHRTAEQHCCVGVQNCTNQQGIPK